MKTLPSSRFTSLLAVFHRYATGFQGIGPLSSRCVVLLLFIVYLLIGPVSKHADIVSASLGYGLLGVVTVAALCVTLQSVRLRRTLQVGVFPPPQESSPHEVLRVALVVPAIRLAPFTCLHLQLDSPMEDFPKTAVRISGSSSLERHVHIDLSLPHRGSWSLTSLRCELRDVTGLVCVHWFQPLSASVVVAPPVEHETRLPLVSSTQRPGDLVVDTLNRQGDPFDIKAYHPSDGIKKIVWKVFAKRGELLSRHPEASMTPEGFVVMMVLARPIDDDACSQALAYAQAVTELKLDIVLGCEGACGREPATRPDDSKTLLIDSVWDAKNLAGTSLQRDATALIDFCSSNVMGCQVRKMLLFCSGNRLAYPEDSRNILELAQWLAVQGIEPVLCVTPPRKLISKRDEGALAAIRALLVEAPVEDAGATPAEAYQRFLSDCLSKHWEVYV